MPKFEAGENIAIKVPAHVYERTVAFWRDTVKLEQISSGEQSTVFRYGPLKLWLDRVPHQSQTDVWLELRTDDAEAAIRELCASGNPVRDELEPLDGINAHWVSDPSGVVLLIHEKEVQQ